MAKVYGLSVEPKDSERLVLEHQKSSEGIKYGDSCSSVEKRLPLDNIEPSFFEFPDWTIAFGDRGDFAKTRVAMLAAHDDTCLCGTLMGRDARLTRPPQSSYLRHRPERRRSDGSSEKQPAASSWIFLANGSVLLGLPGGLVELSDLTSGDFKQMPV